MKLPDLKPSKYIVAVSGGVDSVTLLDLLSNLQGLELVIAHFNHGIRQDSSKDEEFVRRLAKKHGLPFEVGYGHLQSNASEEQARIARYNFLNQVKARYKASAIITAHHQDDLIETALINVLRGTNRKGLSAILDNKKVIRPLINVAKKEIIKYAKTHNLKWREDITNKDTVYLRNYIRLQVVTKLTARQRQELISNIQKVAKNNLDLDHLIAIISHYVEKEGKINRQIFIMLPTGVQDELIAAWLRERDVKDIDKRVIERLSLAIKTAAPGTKQSVKRQLELVIGSSEVQFTNTV